MTHRAVHGRRLTIACGLWVAAIGATGVPARACSTPVFRYALANWPADAYRVVVFHRGTLAKPHQALVDRLGKSGPPRVNMRLDVVDLSAEPDDAMRTLWRAQRDAALPWAVLCYPGPDDSPLPVWSGPLTAASVDALLDSPKRREIARQILDGTCAVWVLLASGNAKQDAAADTMLQTQLKRLQTELRLPDPMDNMGDAPADPQAPEPEKASFSLVRLSRTDPAERTLVAMLLGSEPDLKELSGAMAFPVFGRGRVLYALVGRGINAENILEACARLVGACSCEVKAANPGTDLLMAVDWDDLLPEEALMASGLLGLPATAAPPAAGWDETRPATTQGSVGAASATQPGSARSGPSPTRSGSADPFVRSMWIGIGALALVVLVGSVVVWARARRTRRQ